MGGDEVETNGDDTSEADKLKEECLALRSKLQAIKRKRRRLRRLTEETITDQLLRLSVTAHAAEREQQIAVEEYQAAVTGVNQMTSWLDHAEKWNVTNDCFHIWHRGAFATINGLRLAAQIPVVDAAEAATNGSHQQQPPTATANGQPSLVGSLALAAAATEATASKASKNNPPPSIQENVKIPWVEVNSALGLVVLLLSILGRKPNSGIEYQNKLIPMGSTSRIGIRKGESFTFYNLYSDDNFAIFGKRSFNIALNGLLRCVADASAAVEKIDRTMALPHILELEQSSGIYTIGGLAVAYGPDGDLWTRAMKYVLTDIKWLVAYSTKHLDG